MWLEIMPLQNMTTKLIFHVLTPDWKAYGPRGLKEKSVAKLGSLLPCPLFGSQRLMLSLSCAHAAPSQRTSPQHVT